MAIPTAKPHKYAFTLLSVFLISGYAHAEDIVQGVAILGQTGMYNLTAESTTKTTTSISGYGAHSISVEVGVFNRFKITGGLTYLLSSGISGDTATGYDMGGKYYFWTRATRHTLVYDNFTIDTVERFRPYVGLGVRSREFYSVLSTTYVGFGVLGGADYDFTRQFFANIELRYDSLSGNSDNTLTQTNFLFGIGFNLR